jgi:hypothetical protein
MDIKESMRKAVQLTDDGHPNKPRYLADLSMGQLIHSVHFGGLMDTGESISNTRKAAELTEDGHQNRPFCLLNLGLIQLRRYQRCGKLKDINDSKANCQNAVQLSQEGHSDKLRCLWIFSHLEDAVALLDSGRSIIWQQASSLQSDLGMLRKAEPELAEEFESVRQKLDAGNFSDLLISLGGQHRGLSAGDVGQECCSLAGEWEGLWEKV